MKTTKALRDLSATDLLERVGEFKKELLKLNVQVATGANTASPGRLRLLKKSIARVETLLREKTGAKSS